MPIAVEVGFSFSLSPGSSKTLPLAITNQNNNKSVDWSVDLDAGPMNWLQLDRYSGNLKPMEVQTLYVTANASGMDFGNYQAKLTFSSTSEGINLPDVELWVELHVSFQVFSDNGIHALGSFGSC
jgi:Viral BACON domain